MTPAGKVTFIHRFTVPQRDSGDTGQGALPITPMTEGRDGRLYSTVSRCAGGFDCLYRIDRDGDDFEILHTFSDLEAMSPNELVLGHDGLFYATAEGGGDLGGGIRGDGTVFSFEVQSPPNTGIAMSNDLPVAPAAPLERNRLCELAPQIFCAR
jgi:hypothetical protein